MENQGPGWLPDPFDPRHQRYWDGERWTEETRDAVAAGVAALGEPSRGEFWEATNAPTSSRWRVPILLVLLAVAAGAAFWFTRDDGKGDGPADVAAPTIVVVTTSLTRSTTSTTTTTTTTTTTSTTTTTTTAPPRPPIPEVLGLSQDDATAALAVIGAEIVVRPVETAESAPGLVIAVDPASGSAIEPGTVVTIDVAVAPPQCNAVPNPLPEPTFSDIGALGEEATVSLAWAESVGLVGGSGGAFSPDDPMTRGGVATVLWRYFCEPAAQNPSSFVDVAAEAFYSAAVAWASENGILSGTSPTTFVPDDPITRAQFVTVTWRAVGSPDPGGTAPFADTDAGAFYAAALDWAFSAGLVSGVTADTFAPDDPVSRLTSVVLFYRLETLVDPVV